MTAFNTLRAALSDALAPLTQFPQFVLYRLADNGDGTIDKVPVNPTTLHNGSAQDYTNWMDAQTALAAAEYHNDRVGWNAYGVGFALTQAAGFWVIDVDNCIDAYGNMSPLASEAYNAFRGAAVEKSVSARGIHIWGSGEVPAHAAKYSSQQGKLELYTSHRFIALCGEGAHGFAGNDFTEIISAYAQHYFPPKAEDQIELSDGPCKEWAGPRDDGELIAAALLAEPVQIIPQGAGSAPDISFGDLWTRNVDALRLRYPPNKQGQEFDASDADLALARKLAYWTGRDIARTERLMHASALARDKWQRRRGWITDTIIHAAKKVKTVYGEDNEFAKLDSETQAFYMAQARRFVELCKAKREERMTAAAQGRFHIMDRTELLNQPPLKWLVHNVLPSEGVAAIYGPSGSGKTFLSIDMAIAVADGSRWFGYDVDQAVPVTYLALEGSRGLAKRVDAWERQARRRVGGKLGFIDCAFDMTEKSADVEALATVLNDQGRRNGLTIIDTLSRAAPGADENSSADMGAIIANASKLQRLVGGLVLLVHHTGKTDGKGLRGHSSLYAALDAAIEVTRTTDDSGEKQHSWNIAKSKDGEDGRTVNFDLQVVPLDNDDHGRAITSCVIRAEGFGNAAVPTRKKEVDKKADGPRGSARKIVWRALTEAVQTKPVYNLPGTEDGQPAVHWLDAENAIKQKLRNQRSEVKSRDISNLLEYLLAEEYIAQIGALPDLYYTVSGVQIDQTAHETALTGQTVRV